MARKHSSRIRRSLRRIAIAAGVITASLVVAFAALLIFKPSLNLTAFKSAIEAPLTAFMERPVNSSAGAHRKGLRFRHPAVRGRHRQLAGVDDLHL
ncbi:MAG: hypothetical protein IFK92_03435 [Acidobacteria bacterium]|nr:hypothetical protein [Candidatus Sulfomarinibacter kjeldsenii]